MKVVIQEHLYQRGAACFASAPLQWFRAPKRDEKALLALVKTQAARALVLDSRPFSNAFFEALPSGMLLARFGVGVDNLPQPLCTKKNFKVMITEQALTSSVCEHALSLLLWRVKQLHTIHSQVATGQWQRRPLTALAEKTLGILGWGRTGRAMAKLALALQLKVVVWTRSALVKAAVRGETSSAPSSVLSSVPKQAVEFSADLATVLARSNFISLHLSLNHETRHLLNHTRLRQCRPGAILINTARGALVDEAALYEALAERHLAGAGLDVFENEPYTPVEAGKDLRQLSNVTLTPHLAAHGEVANRRMAEETVGNLLRFAASL